MCQCCMIFQVWERTYAIILRSGRHGGRVTASSSRLMRGGNASNFALHR